MIPGSRIGGVFEQAHRLTDMTGPAVSVASGFSLEALIELADIVKSREYPQTRNLDLV